MKLQPRAARGRGGDQALVELLAEKLGYARSRIELIRDHTSRRKTLLLQGFTPAQVSQKISR